MKEINHILNYCNNSHINMYNTFLDKKYDNIISINLYSDFIFDIGIDIIDEVIDAINSPLDSYFCD